MSYDTFVGLANGTSISGATWDSGDVTWSTGGELVGNGSGSVKAGASALFGNYPALTGHIGQAIFFKQLAGRTDFTLALLNLTIEANGAYDGFGPSVGVRAQIGAYSTLYVRDLAGGTENSAACSLVDGNEYCLEVKQTGTANQYRATVYNASGGVRGTQVATQTVTVATPISTSNKRVFIAGSSQYAYATISRVESVDSAGGGNAVPTFTGTIANVTGTAGTAITNVSTASYFSDTDTLAYSISPSGSALPAGLSINSATGIISGTPSAAGTTTGVKVRATDTASQTVDSNAFNFTIAAASATGNLTTDACTTSGTLRPSGTAVSYTLCLGGVIGTGTGTVTHGSSTLNAQSKLVLTGLTAGSYMVWLKFADGGVSYQEITVS